MKSIFFDGRRYGNSSENGKRRHEKWLRQPRAPRKQINGIDLSFDQNDYP
jgi:hypothetical protein